MDPHSFDNLFFPAAHSTEFDFAQGGFADMHDGTAPLSLDALNSQLDQHLDSLHRIDLTSPWGSIGVRFGEGE